MYALFAGVHIAAPGLAVLIVSLVTLSIWRIWLAPRIQSDEPVGQAGSLPPWPTTPEDESLSLVVGEGGSKRTLAGIIFGLGMAIEAARVLTWLF